MARGTYIYPPRASLRIVTDIFAYCDRDLPNWNTISISGYHIREAGSTAVQEVAFTFAHAIAYVQAAIDAGLDVNRLGPRLSFFFNAHNDFLEEVAKYRAARRLWAHIMRDRFGATNPRAQQLRFHTQTAGSTLTAQQPDNNIVRVAMQALAAVMGGTQSLHCNGRDEAMALPTEESAAIALRTQQVIAWESGVINTVDPFGGSYAIEALTDRIEGEAKALLGDGLTTVAVKQGLGRFSARHIAPVRARELIEKAAASALSDLGAVSPWSPGSPCEIRIELATSDEVERYRHHAVVEIVDGRTLVSRADDWWTAWRQFYFTFFRDL